EEIIEELAAPVEPVPETVQASEPEPEPKPEPLDDMISHVESIKEKKQPGSAPLPVQPSGQPDFDEFIGDTMLVAEEHTEELDDAFQEVAGRGKIPVARKSENKNEVSEEVSPFDSIVPEPEDLLEKMAPSAFSRGKGSARPDLIGDSLTFLSEGSIESRRPTIKTTEQVSRTPVYKQSLDSGEERFVQVVGEHVKRLLEKSLATSLEKEISGLSEMIAQSVKKVVKEIAPGIAREIIKQEVDKIKNM
ncbi:MAG: hypothetical protein VX667_01975, partial [Nitrospinota bacterium]|nr:hypothetical protein [Nitrospinota bacterium]